MKHERAIQPVGSGKRFLAVFLAGGVALSSLPVDALCAALCSCLGHNDAVCETSHGSTCDGEAADSSGGTMPCCGGLEGCVNGCACEGCGCSLSGRTNADPWNTFERTWFVKEWFDVQPVTTLQAPTDCAATFPDFRPAPVPFRPPPDALLGPANYSHAPPATPA